MMANRKGVDTRGLTLLLAQLIIMISVIVFYIYLSATQVSGPARVIKGYGARVDVDSLLYQWTDANVNLLQAQDPKAVQSLKNWFTDHGYAADVSCKKLREAVFGCELNLVKSDGAKDRREVFKRDILVPTQNGVLTVFMTGTVTV